MGHNGDRTAKTGRVHRGDVLPVDQHAPRVQIVQTLQQLDESTLSRPRLADQRNFFTGPDINRQV